MSGSDQAWKVRLADADAACIVRGVELTAEAKLASLAPLTQELAVRIRRSLLLRVLYRGAEAVTSRGKGLAHTGSS